MSSKGKVDDIELVLSGFECVGLIFRSPGGTLTAATAH